MKYVLIVALMLCCGNAYALPTMTQETKEEVCFVVPTIKWFNQKRPVRKFLHRALAPTPPKNVVPKGR